MSNNPKLRNYQIEMFRNIRDAFKFNRAVLAEMPTGAGKSIVMAKIVESFLSVSKRWNLDRDLYFLIDELYLMSQFSEHLNKWGIAHDIIGGGEKEGRPVKVHVCTVQSLRRHPPKNEPFMFIVDEAHLSTSPQFMDLFETYEDAKILGFTASPETASGKGLSANWLKDENGFILRDEQNKKCKTGNGIFEILIESPVSMLELTEGIEETDPAGITQIYKYLCPVRYYGVPMSGVEDLHMRAGEFIDKEVEKLLAEKGTYGDSIKEMNKFPDIKSHILFFCKSVKSCYEMKTVLDSNGYYSEVLEGTLTKSQRKKVMKGFKSGKIQVLVTCRMVLKGVDLPFILMGVDTSITPSRTIQRQKVGRVARLFENKEYAPFLDMVGNHRVFPNGDIYSAIDWNFTSEKYNKKPSETTQDNYCPLCYAFIPANTTICPECGAEKKITPKKEKPKKHMDGELIEIVPLADRDPEEKTQIQLSINAALRDDDIDKLYEIACTLTSKKKAPLWVYYKLCQTENIVDIPLLYRLQRQLKFKQGWVYYIKNQIKVNKSA